MDCFRLPEIFIPWSPLQQTIREEFVKLELNQKIKVVFLTVIAVLAGCGLLSIFTGQLGFYHAVDHYWAINNLTSTL